MTIQPPAAQPMLRTRRALAVLMVVTLGAPAALVPPHVDPYHLDPYSFGVTARRPAGTPAGQDCPHGWLCLYAGPDFGYPPGAPAPCGFVELAPYGWSRRVRSVHSNLTDPADPAPPFDKVWFYAHPAPGETFSGRHLLASVDGHWTGIIDSAYLQSAEYLHYDCERRKRLRPPKGTWVDELGRPSVEPSSSTMRMPRSGTHTSLDEHGAA